MKCPGMNWAASGELACVSARTPSVQIVAGGRAGGHWHEAGRVSMNFGRAGWDEKSGKLMPTNVIKASKVTKNHQNDLIETP